MIAGSDGVVEWNMCDTNDMCKNSFLLYLWRIDMFTTFGPGDGAAAGWKEGVCDTNFTCAKVGLLGP